MKYSINLMLAVQKSNGKVQKTYKGKGLLVLKTPLLICNKDRQAESCRGTKRTGDFWISITPPNVPLKDRSTTSPFSVCQRRLISSIPLALPSIPCLCHGNMWILTNWLNIPTHGNIAYRNTYTIWYTTWNTQNIQNQISLGSGPRDCLSGAGLWCCWRLCHPRKAQAGDSAHQLLCAEGSKDL